MLVYDFTNKENEVLLEAKRNTVMIMARVPKVIMFETGDELRTMADVLEHLSELADDREDENAEVALSMFDEFEQESYMKDEEEYSSRNLKVFTCKDDALLYDDKISIFFGVLNSRDCFLEPDEVKVILTYFKEFIGSDMCKDATKEMLLQIVQVLEEDLQALKENKPYFKVEVDGN
ncbi:hypothetical protein [Bacillus sp. NPDC094106]|uniref:hypothetical protein n=1 Tax=Bacillus sp. NPDC094106 TaxID=3363949 RepID=UPI00380A79C0